MDSNFFYVLNKSLKFFSFSFLITIAICSACSHSETAQKLEKQSIKVEKNLVEVITLAQQDFTREILSNGKLSASRKATLWFKSAGIVKSITVKNGQFIREGSLVADLQPEDFLTSLKRAEAAFERARIDRLNAFLAMGYKQADSASISAEHRKIAEIKSGYSESAISLEEARRQYESASLVAPISGKVEGISQQPWEKADLSKPFCSIIDDALFNVAFPLLEAEVGEVAPGQRVVVTPVAGAKEGTGAITSINPRVDENGLAWLTAEVKNPGGYIEGMNAKISIRKIIPGKLVVPKQAVVIRQDRHVLFCYKSGIAWWTYVNVLDENEKFYAVEAAEGATLSAGDTVIVSNNLNLAHESAVTLK